MERIVIVGATSVIAQETLRARLASSNAEVHLIGRDADRLDAVRADLAVRLPSSSFTVEAFDLTDIDAIAAAATRLTEESAPELVLIAHGSLGSQERAQEDLRLAHEQLTVTGVSPALWMEAFADRMTRGTIAVIGSVAGDRGRKSNYLYGAAKGLIERVAEGLQHRLAGSQVHVVLIKPGPTRTPMTDHLAQVGARLADAHDVGARVASAIAARRRTVYAPAIWRPIMLVVRSIPAPIFNRLDL
ncbi:SDR family NAD(P)-dependent oxidoreductase [Curtobacterium ammoniigenes]|uniref:SDR family NAD(P)-dependent oxidoreductase n=1 Tax=Curtobacterium ammoniigenes TaxID=395387 RepID=UPI000AAD7287|nr:SDR family NAD(P)-dependent oxidoreductase [Curtobacterium ammoniigenes]